METAQILELLKIRQRGAENYLLDETIVYLLRETENLDCKDCAVICRTHSQLDKFAKILTAKNIPVFYLGELFEREEVRDLPTLLDLKVSAKSHSLIRVAQFPEYKIPLADARKIIRSQRENRQTFVEVLRDESLTDELSIFPKSTLNCKRYF